MNGALTDERSDEEKAKDYHLDEIVANVNPVSWVEKPQKDWRNFPIFNQNGSGSCVAQTMAKLLGIMYWIKNQTYVHFSATHVYQRRSNKPAGGMNGVNAFEIAKEGVTLEDLVPSQGMTDNQMDYAIIPEYKEDVGEIFKISNYINVPARSFDTVASIIQTTGKGVMVWFYFEYNEWTDNPVVKNSTLKLNGANTCRHSVTAVDAVLINGKKYLIIEDSWGPNYGLGGQRTISEEFFKARNWFAAYPMNFKFDDKSEPLPLPDPKPSPDRPKHTFNNDLEFGTRDSEVIVLQNILKLEGVFPTNVESTGYFGSITKRAVGKFQDKYNIAHTGNAGYGRVGPLTRNKLNQIYG